MRLNFQPTWKPTDMRTGGADTPALFEKDKIWDAFIYTSEVVNPRNTYEDLISHEILHILWFKDGLGEIHNNHSNSSNGDVYDVWKELNVPIDGNIDLHNDMPKLYRQNGDVFLIGKEKKHLIINYYTLAKGHEIKLWNKEQIEEKDLSSYGEGDVVILVENQ